MSSLVAISSNNLVSTSFNNQHRHSFPASANFKNVEVAIQSISMYNSQFNVDSVAYSNNIFKIEMPTAATVSTISITLKDGIYSYTDINRMIQTALVNVGACLVDLNGDNVFWIQLVENSTYYAAQLDVSSVPTALGTYTRPATGLYSATGTGLPTTGRVPRLIVDNAAFGKPIGFSVGQYPSASSTVAASFLSDLAPEVNPVSADVVRCSLVNNTFTSPPDILTVFNSQGTSAGQLIAYQPNECSWTRVNDGSYSTITITIVDQLERFIKFRDPNLLISLIFREAQK
ncbi:hypothetical protein PHYSODRAFT_495808 [Phytophthora sojae]|uniref:Uncharacterized protein n=1 Tax=Phytophthora sojae (strain P6497) TaxID=1094619 RepID=G4ZBL3_PHYSP|nr:hypothetical protein PHYSODRAFT_495808 [Phytophthora sojae]EGZ20627.1 hypothetical protein PHYSODRAFT_495808 [Phytophthora sojae]|eukprot:XP_009523344.1 hypothetical protein PHYSODRAFT_495808 [Phytophthora sojae]